MLDYSVKTYGWDKLMYIFNFPPCSLVCILSEFSTETIIGHHVKLKWNEIIQFAV